MSLSKSKDLPTAHSPRKKLFLIALFVVFANLFFFRPLGNTGFSLLASGFLILIFALWGFGTLKTFSQTFLLGLLGFWIINVLQTLFLSNPFLSFLLKSTQIITLGLFSYLLVTKLAFVRSLMELVLIPITLGWVYFKASLKILLGPKLINNSSVKKIDHYFSWRSLGWGLVLGLPATIILISLLSSGDPIFAHFMKKVFSSFSLPHLSKRIVSSVLLLAFLSPLILLKRKSKFLSPLKILPLAHLIPEMTIVISLVSLTLGTFLIVQWPYIFARVPKETDLSQFGVATYSEYVQKGFGELILATLFIFSLVWIGLLIWRNRNKKIRPLLPSLQLVVLGELVLFILSIFRRVWLYQAYHGWTLVRLYGSFFLFWIFLITLTLAARHLWEKRWVTVEVIFSGLLTIILPFFNPEAFLVRHPPTVNQRVDYIYLSRLSSDGYLGWEKAFHFAEKTILDTDWGKQDLIDKENRREIVYAGIVTNQLLANYDSLIRQYGSHQEITSYFVSILSAFKQVNQERLEKLKERHLEYPTSILAEQSKIEQSLKTLKADLPWSEKKLPEIWPTYPGYYHPNFTFTQQPSDLKNSHFAFFYHLNTTRNDPYQPADKLAQVLNWNASQQQAYQRMKEEIGFLDLLKLQEKYRQIYSRILSQPENERDYDQDISLKTPFLGEF
ncbi:DUF4153 domain-containing protein [Patescibacteria group bacterium]